MDLERRWYTAREIGNYLKLSLKGVYKACSCRRLPFSKIPGVGVRIDKQALDALLERLAISPERFGATLKKQNPNKGGK
jgi:excisionase family DNA binding protein